MADPYIHEIAKPAGGIVALSLKLGLSRGAVSQWARVPSDRIADVARITGLTREKIRPDLYLDATWLPEQVRQKVEAA